MSSETAKAAIVLKMCYGESKIHATVKLSHAVDVALALVQEERERAIKIVSEYDRDWCNADGTSGDPPLEIVIDEIAASIRGDV